MAAISRRCDPLSESEITDHVSGRSSGVDTDRTDSAALEASLRRQTAIAAVAQHALDGGDIAALLQAATERVVDALRADIGLVFELQPAGDVLQLVAATGVDPALVGKSTIPAGAGTQAAYVLMTNPSPTIVANLRHETHFPPSPLLLEHGVVSSIIVTIPGREHPFGWIAAHSLQRRDFTREEAGFLQSVSQLLCTAMARRHTETVLAESEARLRHAAAHRGRQQAPSREGQGHYDLFEQSTDAVLIHDLSGRVVDANGRARELLGRRRDELVGAPLAIVWAQSSPVALQAALAELVRSGSLRRETHWRRSDGTVIDVEISARLLNEPAGPVVIIARDVTGRLRNERERERQRGYLAALHETGVALINRMDLHELLDAIIAHAAASLHTVHGFVYLLDEAKGGLVRAADAGLFSEVLVDVIRPGQAMSGKVLLTGEPMTVAAYQSWPERIARPGAESIQSMAVVPLKSAGRVQGVLGLARTEPGAAFDAGEVAFLSQLGQLAAIALDNVRLYEATQQELEERRRAETALRESEEHFRIAFDGALIGMAMYTTAGKWLRVNRALCDMLGYSEDELLSLNIPAITHPDNLATARDRLDELARGVSGAEPREKRYLHKDGRDVWVSITATLVFGADGRPAYVVSQIANITERKQAEEALRQSEERFRMLVENVKDYAIFMLDPNGCVESWNAGAERINGYRAEEIVGQHFSLFYPQEDIAAGKPAHELLVAQAEGRYEEEGWRLRKDGSRLWASVIITALYDEAGNLRGYGKATRDNTDRRQAEEARAQLIREQAARAEAEAAQRRLAFLAEASALLGSSLDYQATLQRVARFCVTSLADWCSVDLLRDDGSLQHVIIAHADPHKEQLAEIVRQKFPYDPDAPDGLARVLRTGEAVLMPEIADEMIAAVIRNPEDLALVQQLQLRSYMCVPLTYHGKVLGAVSLAMAESGRHYGAADLGLATEIARHAGLAIENARLYSEAQDALRVRDEFLSTAAHELKTPLTVIKGYTQLLTRGSSLGEQRYLRTATVIDRQCDRLVELVGQLLDVSRLTLGRFELQRERCDLRELVAESIERMQSLTAEHHITMDAVEPVLVMADRGRIDQVLVNLISNAIKFSPQGGEIAATVERRDGSAIVTVRDRGLGIPKGRQRHIFEQFYRAHAGTPHDYGGMGIGLHFSRQLILEHGGTMWFESEAGHGSTFAFSLPLASDVSLMGESSELPNSKTFTQGSIDEQRQSVPAKGGREVPQPSETLVGDIK